MKKILLINGLPRSGKDTMADYLVENYGYTKFSFADEMKNIMCRLFDIDRDTLDRYKNNPDEVKVIIEENKTLSDITNFRTLLQRFGNEAMKPSFGDRVWADLTYKLIMECPNDKIVVPDFRFMCEYIPSFDYELDTVLILDDRPLPTEGHASDVELYKNCFPFRVMLNNNKDERFFEEIDMYMKYLTEYYTHLDKGK